MYNLLVILGPTASGKTRLAAELAYTWQTELISADSRQVYRGMDIGTGKDLADYKVNDQTIYAHIVDILEAGEQYHLTAFQEDFEQAFTMISSKGRTPILVGGTGLYIEATLNQFEYSLVPMISGLRAELEKKDKGELLELFQKTHTSYSEIADLSTKKRIIRAIEINHYLATNEFAPKGKLPLQPLVIGLQLSQEERRRRITERLHQRLKQGMVEEVRSLLQKGVAPEKLVFYGLEYKFITHYLQQEMTYEEMVEKLNIAIHQFAKRQMTYFRHMERKGIAIHWLNANKPREELIKEIQFLWNQ